ncbi:MAG: hypothetical protein NVSMB56_05630 [Pyrinomonadaceae bacterium]
MTSEQATARETHSTRLTNLFAREDCSIYILILLYLCIAIPLAFKLNIWLDEAYTLNTTARGVGYAFHQALHFELQPPLYFVLMSVWRKLSSSIFFARLFSIICVALFINISAGLARYFCKDANPSLLVAAFAFNPFVIWTALEIRLYALALLLSALLLKYFYEGYIAEKPDAQARVLYIFVAIGALYTQYYLGFLLVANACALLIFGARRRTWKPVLVYAAGMCAVGICFAPMLLVTFKQISAHTQTVILSPSFKQIIKDISWRAQDYLLPAIGERAEFFRHWLLRLGLFTLLILIFKHRLRLLTIQHVALFVINCVVAFFFVVVLQLTGEDLFQPKHSVVWIVPLLLLTWSIIISLSGKIGARVWLCVTLIFYATTFYATYKPLAKSGDWARVATYIEANERENEAVAVFHAESALPLSNYYKGRNKLIALPDELHSDRIDWRDFVLQDEAQIERALARAGMPERVWLVTDDFCSYLSVDFNCGLLEVYVKKNYTIISVQNFYQSKVRLLRRN